MSIWKIGKNSTQAIYLHINLVLIENFFCSSLPQKCKEDSYERKYDTSFFTLSFLTHKPSKVPAKPFFSSLYVIDTTFFNEYFLFRVITERKFFLWKFIVTLKYLFIGLLLLLLLLFSSKEVLGDVCVLRYLRNSRTILMPKFQNKRVIIILVHFSYIVLCFDCMQFLPSFISWLFTWLSGGMFFTMSHNQTL